jgi:heme/copper-type cytochrome/quinol oxidase subunit 2
MKKYLLAAVTAVAVSAQAVQAQAVDAAVSSAIADGLTSTNTYLTAAIAIPVAFFVFKLGKRVIGRA